jgi:hypothetical protein
MRHKYKRKRMPIRNYTLWAVWACIMDPDAPNEGNGVTLALPMSASEFETYRECMINVFWNDTKPRKGHTT